MISKNIRTNQSPRMEKWFQNEKKEEKKPKERGQLQATQNKKNKFIIKQQHVRKIKELQDTKMDN